MKNTKKITTKAQEGIKHEFRITTEGTEFTELSFSVLSVFSVVIFFLVSSW